MKRGERELVARGRLICCSACRSGCGAGFSNVMHLGFLLRSGCGVSRPPWLRTPRFASVQIAP